MLYQLKPDEMIYVGRLMRPPVTCSERASQPQREPAPGFKQKPGSGVLVASEKPDAELNGLAAELKQAAGQINVACRDGFFRAAAATRRIHGPGQTPRRTVHLSIATAWPSTPAE